MKSNKIVILVFIILLIVSLLVWLVGPFLRTANAPVSEKPAPSASPSIPASFNVPAGSPKVNGPAVLPSTIY